jgi:hypothetical protein
VFEAIALPKLRLSLISYSDIVKVKLSKELLSMASGFCDKVFYKKFNLSIVCLVIEAYLAAFSLRVF